MYVGVDKVLLIMRVYGYQCALIFRPTSCLGAFVILQFIYILETLFVSIPSPAVRTRVLLFDGFRANESTFLEISLI